MSITHTFIDYIPSIFLGAPDEDSFLSILPGHRMLLKGHGFAAVTLTLYGSLTALIIILIFTPLFITILPIIYPYIQTLMPFILIIISIYLIYNESEYEKDYPIQKITNALFIFLLAGFLGIASLNLPIDQPLLPLLTGLFGTSTLLISIKNKIKIPKQKILKLNQIKLSRKSFLQATKASIIASPFTAFLPGLGASQAAVIGKQSAKELDSRGFLFLLGAINTIVMGLSFITLYTIGKTRTGSALAVSQILSELTIKNLAIILTTINLTGILAFILAISLAKLSAKYITKFNYTKISKVIILVLVILTLYFTGILGLLVLITATSLGIYTITKQIKRIHLMGCLIIPTILFYMF